jgi:hypothetical protein
VRACSLVLLALALGMGLTVGPGAPPAEAGTLWTKVFDFNTCDQYHSGHPVCNDVTPQERADKISASVVSGGSNVVTLQEVCLSTLNRIVANLGQSYWAGKHLWTTFDINDGRCGISNEWGLGIIARGPLDLNSVGWALLPNPNGTPDPTGQNGPEPRYLFCGNFLISAWFRVCSSHFSVQENAATA